MSRNLFHKSIAAILPVFGLMLLLVLSPCTVRNFLQVELGVQQTEVTNKSKTTLNQSHCSNFENAESTFAGEKPTSLQQPEFIAKSEFSFGFTVLSNDFDQTITASESSASAVPLYILYQNFKDYL